MNQRTNPDICVASHRQRTFPKFPQPKGVKPPLGDIAALRKTGAAMQYQQEIEQADMLFGRSRTVVQKSRGGLIQTFKNRKPIKTMKGLATGGAA